ncbi:unnamed protein product [Dicrocoelium dendriticum]|nr:unnamed protein product [Dicrocoelium dendriticum]
MGGNRPALVSENNTPNSLVRPKKRARRPNRTPTTQPPAVSTPCSLPPISKNSACSAPASTSVLCAAPSSPFTTLEIVSYSQPAILNNPATYASVAAKQTPERSPVTFVPGLEKTKLPQHGWHTPMPFTNSTKTPDTEPLNPKPVATRRNHGVLSIVCTNVPKSKSNTIKGKLTDDRNQWGSICTSIGVHANPTKVRRISRHQNALHYGEPRLLRVTLNSADETEAVLLSANSLRNDSSGVRILPEIPWKERAGDRANKDSYRISQDKKTVIAHCVPELTDSSSDDAQMHDREEWHYIREKVEATIKLRTIICLDGESSPGPTGQIIVRGLIVASTFYENYTTHKIHKQFLLFADDVKIWRTINNNIDHDLLQHDLDRIYEWSKRNMLQLNIAKCKVIHLRHQPGGAYKLGDHTLEKVSQVRDLSVLVQEDLECTKQAEKATRTGNQQFGLLRRALGRFEPSIFPQMLNAYVRSHVELAIQAWQPWQKHDLVALETPQRRATKNIRGLFHLPYQLRPKSLRMYSSRYRLLRGSHNGLPNSEEPKPHLSSAAGIEPQH